jgi:hypothetical protein
MLVQGSTQISMIIGHPIAQVRSPIPFNQHFSGHCQVERAEGWAALALDAVSPVFGRMLPAKRFKVFPGVTGHKSGATDQASD